MIRFLIISSLLVFDQPIFSQTDLGVKINIGLSKLSNSFVKSENVQLRPSGHAGVFYNHSISKKSIIGIELVFMQIEGGEKTQINVVDINGNKIGDGTGNIYKHISYIVVPIYYGIHFNKFTAHLGGQVSFAINSSARELAKLTVDGNVLHLDNRYESLEIHPFDFGAQAGITYKLRNKFAIEGAYYHGITNILDTQNLSRIHGSWRVRQATIGLMYSLNSTDSSQ